MDYGDNQSRLYHARGHGQASAIFPPFPPSLPLYPSFFFFPSFPPSLCITLFPFPLPFSLSYPFPKIQLRDPGSAVSSPSEVRVMWFGWTDKIIILYVWPWWQTLYAAPLLFQAYVRASSFRVSGQTPPGKVLPRTGVPKTSALPDKRPLPGWLAL